MTIYYDSLGKTKKRKEENLIPLKVVYELLGFKGRLCLDPRERGEKFESSSIPASGDENIFSRL